MIKYINFSVQMGVPVKAKSPAPYGIYCSYIKLDVDGMK